MGRIPFVSKSGKIVLRSPFHKIKKKANDRKLLDCLKKYYSALPEQDELIGKKYAKSRSQNGFKEKSNPQTDKKSVKKGQKNVPDIVTNRSRVRRQKKKGKAGHKNGFGAKKVKLDSDSDEESILEGDGESVGVSSDLPIANDLDDTSAKKKKKVNEKKEENVRRWNPSSIISYANSLSERMKDRLNSSRFRHINEQLYTHTSEEAAEGFRNNPSAFQIYHTGYQRQLEKWPVKPIDLMIKLANKKPANWVIANMGCGDAKLAASVKQKVHSFDLVSTTKGVVNCDMAHVPLKDKSVNMVVYCLSLMGTNVEDFLLEANRILVDGGLLKIAEVESRFTSLGSFIQGVEGLGFSLQKKDATNKMFLLFHFAKVGPPRPRKNRRTFRLKPCLYKKR